MERSEPVKPTEPLWGAKRKELTRSERHLGDQYGAPNTTLNRKQPQPASHSKEAKELPLAQECYWAWPSLQQYGSFGAKPGGIADQYRTSVAVESLFHQKLCPIGKTESGAVLYGPGGRELTNTPPSRPLKIAFLTSIRDVGIEEHVGKRADAGNPKSYVKGTIETALDAVKDDRLGRFAEVVAIITDDLSSDLRKGDYVADPRRGGAWIFPRYLRNSKGELATSLTVNVPSTFRALPLKDVEGRKAQKIDFETKIFKILCETGADILLSDHFLARIEYLIRPDSFGMLGRVLNTHPGIIRPDHPYPCLGKATYDHMRLHAQGLRRLTDKSVVRVPVCDLAGASFHFITAGIDRGPVLCDAELTRISPTDSDATVARKLYETSKYHAFIEGVRHYASNIFPMFGNN